jgi:protein-tyrosine phosphatase
MTPVPVPAFTVLVVCTGNICRSPLAERLGRARLDLLLGASGVVRLESAGTRAVVGSAMDPASARVLEELGGDSAGFVAHQLTDQLAASADLTLTMTRGHRRDVLGRAPRAMSRTFTLREAAGLLELLGEDLSLDGAPAERARALVQRMAGARSLRPSGREDDVIDPIGQSAEVHASVGAAVADALLPVLDRFAGVLGEVPLPAGWADRRA